MHSFQKTKQKQRNRKDVKVVNSPTHLTLYTLSNSEWLTERHASFELVSINSSKQNNYYGTGQTVNTVNSYMAYLLETTINFTSTGIVNWFYNTDL